MSLIRWDPWRDIRTMERQFDDLLGTLNRSSSGSAARGWMPLVDVHQEADQMVIRAELAGVEPDDVDITVENSMLRISGTREEDRDVSEGNWIHRERFSGRFERVISLPQDVDEDQIEATTKNGVVEIHVPTQQKAAGPRRIKLQGQQDANVLDVTGQPQQREGGGQEAGGQEAQHEEARGQGTAAASQSESRSEESAGQSTNA